MSIENQIQNIENQYKDLNMDVLNGKNYTYQLLAKKQDKRYNFDVSFETG